MRPINLLFCFIFLTIFRHLRAYFCKNSLIEIYGGLDYGSEEFFSDVGSRYARFRQSTCELNVTIKKAIGPVRTGLVGPVGNPPIIFVSTPYIAAVHSNGVAFPLYAHGIVILYNLPGINNLNITARGIANIYMGTIKYWNDSYISKYNPNAVLPFKKIIPVARMDPEGSTAFLTRLFSANEPNWNSTYGVFSSPSFVGGSCCNSTTWPQQVDYIFGNGVVGMVGVVLSYQYTIGYAVMEAVRQYNVSIAGLAKTNDSLTKVIQPNVKTIQKAMYSFLDDNGPDAFEITSDTLFRDVSAYPLTVFSSFIMNYTYDNLIDCCLVQELVGFVDWFYNASMDEYLLSQGYVPIVHEITDRIKRLVLPRIKCWQGPVYPAYLESLILERTSLTGGQIALISTACCLALSILIIITVYIYYNQNKNDYNRWLIDPRRINVIEDKNSFYGNNNNKSDTKSVLSASSRNTGKLQGTTASINTEKKLHDLKHVMIKAEFDDTTIQLNKLRCKYPTQWSGSTKKWVSKMKNLMSRHVARLQGITVIGSVPHTVFEYSAQGTLHYVLKTSRYNLTKDIKHHFALDAARGLIYLHNHKIVHGFLSSVTCYIDSSWTVKINGWEKMSIYLEENTNKVKEEVTFFQETFIESRQSLIRLLYIDPNLIKNYNSEKVDIFSFGFLLLEIFSRQAPYNDEVERGELVYADIISQKFSKHHIVQQTMNEIPLEIVKLFYMCTGIENNRPTMAWILSELAKNVTAGKSIVDIVMETVEKHADMLEEKVEERTTELKKVTNDMLNLLNEVLPAQIAAQLVAGQTVQPEQFECVTIYFSDIVGFTTISAISSPIDVMTFLNDLWLAFDNTIDKYDAYKVDTIGDAYMVCSGLPNRNGMEHCRQIALLALALRDMCGSFKIRHLPDEKLKVRIGINSGPVTAGVVGAKMPQYCVFGDAVNTASRMESTSIAQQIHMSEISCFQLKDHFPGLFETAYRGEIDVKGKGTMRTHWLIGQKSESDKTTNDTNDTSKTFYHNYKMNTH